MAHTNMSFFPVSYTHLRANKQRNVFVTIALFLTAFMITSVFSLGCSYFETYQMQQIRAMGTTADVAITSLSEEQYEELSRSSLVSVVGVSQRLGSIDTSGMDDALLSITSVSYTHLQSLQDYKAQVQSEIEQEAADAGMTVEEYAAAGFEAPQQDSFSKMCIRDRPGTGQPPRQPHP